MTIHTSRRSFLGTAAGIAGLSALELENASAVIEPEPWGIKLGVATYSLRSFDRAKAIEMIKQLRVPYVSIKDVHLSQKGTPEEWTAARKEFESAGLKIMSGGNVDMKDADYEGIKHHFEYAKYTGMPMMVCAPTHETIGMVEKAVKEYNIRIAIHNHGPEDKHFPTPQSVLEVVRKLDSRCGLCMDVGHSVRAGADVVKSIADAGDRLFDMHVKDLTSLTPPFSGASFGQCDVGDGAMPFPQIFKQLKKMNYKGCVNLEYEINAKDPMPGMFRSYSYMRGVLAGLAAA
jgi:sugar phosphate isomerase/epimerase